MESIVYYRKNNNLISKQFYNYDLIFISFCAALMCYWVVQINSIQFFPSIILV